jgi:hypothetical protein
MTSEQIREMMVLSLKNHAKGHIDKHIANVEIYLHNPAGIGEHSDIVESVEKELMEVAKYDDVIEMIEKYIE